MNRSIKSIFVASLLLNLLLSGIIIGHIWWHLSGPWAEIADIITPGLPADKKEMIAGTMEKIHVHTENLHRQILVSRDRAAEILKATPFDPPAYLAEVHRGQALRQQMGQTVSENLAATAMNMTAEDRALLANALRQVPCGGTGMGNEPHGQPHKPD